MSRHPYTHAADFVRLLGPSGREGIILSRSDASEIYRGIAKAIGMPEDEMANKLSLAEQDKGTDVREKEIAKILIPR